VTLFALIFAIGILVDDAIVVVENIHRHYQLGWTSPKRAAIYATDEVGNPTILATFAVIAALLPLAFVSGLMGPYMRPIPINASAAMFFSLLVAFIITPWLALRVVKPHHRESADSPEAETRAEHRVERIYSRFMRPLIRRPKLGGAALAIVALLLGGSILLLFVRAVPVKMLPFDNKSEFQVVIDRKAPPWSRPARARAISRRWCGRSRRSPTSRSTRELPDRSTSTAWSGTTSCAAARTWPIFR
jgi:multidrug efflux pump subunit AcrB